MQVKMNNRGFIKNEFQAEQRETKGIKMSRNFIIMGACTGIATIAGTIFIHALSEHCGSLEAFGGLLSTVLIVGGIMFGLGVCWKR